ncbi:unnamed protein product, partial [marine sediment metagenome]
MANFGNELYPPELQDDKRVLANLQILLAWLVDRKLTPKLELFSGDPFSLQAVSMILDKFENAESKPKSIVIPTNYTFILSKALTEKIESLVERSRRLGIPIFLSASIDGRYCEANRPFRSGKSDPRDDGYYDRVFAFNKKWGFSFHPMIYSDRIDSWQNNFLWFQEMLKKHDIPWSNIYLLEVRNKEWSRDNILGFEEFIKFLIRWIFFV